jgi:hypothetical protein
VLIAEYYASVYAFDLFNHVSYGIIQLTAIYRSEDSFHSKKWTLLCIHSLVANRRVHDLDGDV